MKYESNIDVDSEVKKRTGRMSTQTLLMALVLSLVGSLHCAGMCGGFAVLTRMQKGRFPISVPFIVYAMGKAMTYAMLGLGLGVVGGGVDSLVRGANLLAWISGSLMIFVGLHLAGWSLLGRWVSRVPGSRFIERFGQIIRVESLTSRWMMGMLNGLLPCGLLYAALAMSFSQGTALGGAAFMFVFGLGTIPSLLLMAVLGSMMNQALRKNLGRLSGWFVMLLGLLTIVRGSGVMTSMSDHM